MIGAWITLAILILFLSGLVFIVVRSDKEITRNKRQFEHFKPEDKEWWDRWGDAKKIVETDIFALLEDPKPAPKVSVILTRAQGTPAPEAPKEIEPVKEPEPVRFGSPEYWDTYLPADLAEAMYERDKELARVKKKLQPPKGRAAGSPPKGGSGISRPRPTASRLPYEMHELKGTQSSGTIVEPYQSWTAFCTCGFDVTGLTERHAELQIELHRKQVRLDEIAEETGHVSPELESVRQEIGEALRQATDDVRRYETGRDWEDIEEKEKKRRQERLYEKRRRWLEEGNDYSPDFDWETGSGTGRTWEEAEREYERYERTHGRRFSGP